MNHFIRSYRHLWLAPFIGLLLCGSAVRVIASQHLFEAFKRIIVIDPGHGGQDVGARGPDGSLEKTVTMALARLLASQLEPEFKVILTRTDDYEVELDQRTALANHLKADVFISIHTAAGFAHSKTGSAVYHYRNFSQPETEPQPGPGPGDPTSNKPILWQNIQTRHIERSRALAQAINDRLKRISAVHSLIEGIPLAVLQGADMPAVLVEAGHLTNPAEEKNLRDDRFLTALAEQIRLGIDEFFAQNE